MSTYLLVWDAPNMDMGLGSLLGGRPTAAHRPRFDAIGRWLVYRAVDVDADPQAAVFTNVSPGGADVIRPWVEAIRNVGFGVFAKQKIHEDDDVDPDMIDHIEKLRDDLAGVVVASADGQNFQPLLEELIDEGLPVTVLGSTNTPPGPWATPRSSSLTQKILTASSASRCRASTWITCLKVVHGSSHSARWLRY